MNEITISRDQMTREQFTAEYANAVPYGMDASLLVDCQETLQAWREAVINHYFDGESHRGIGERQRMVKAKEAAFAAVRSAYRAAKARQVVCVAA